MSPLTSRRYVHPGLDNHFLLGGLSSESRLLRESRADQHHIGGQDVEFIFYRRLHLPYCIWKPALNFCCTFENSVFDLSILSVKLSVVN